MRERTGFIRGLLILSYLTEKNAILCKKGDNSKHTKLGFNITSIIQTNIDSVQTKHRGE
jgi:hypothetical protein